MVWIKSLFTWNKHAKKKKKDNEVSGGPGDMATNAAQCSVLLDATQWWSWCMQPHLPQLWGEASGYTELGMGVLSALPCFWALNVGCDVPSLCFPFPCRHPNCKHPTTNACRCRRHAQKKNTDPSCLAPGFRGPVESPWPCQPGFLLSFKEQLLYPCRLCSNCAMQDFI